MDIIWDKNVMLNLMKSFHTLFKVCISFFDTEGKSTLGYPAQSKYCHIIRSHKTGIAACRRCDANAFKQAAKLKAPIVYECHAGLIEIVAPVITFDNIQIGSIMLGQARSPRNRSERAWKELEKKAEFPITQKLKSAYLKLPVLDLKHSKACITILQALVTNAWYDNYFRLQREPLSSRVNSYITQNINKNLSLNEIALTFKVGKTTLCKTVKNDFKVSINELIRSLRIKKAKQLLQTAELPIYLIAEQVGIPDYNYFTKVFKTEIGVTPSEFRKRYENGNTPVNTETA